MRLLNREEHAASRVSALLYEAKQQPINIFLSFINLGEIYYIIGRRRGKSVAEETLAKIRMLSLAILPVNEVTAMQAAPYKILHPIFYAAAFAVLATLQQNAILFKGDPEFDQLCGLISIEMLQRNA